MTPSACSRRSRPSCSPKHLPHEVLWACIAAAAAARRSHQRGGVVNIKAFFVDALVGALDLGSARPTTCSATSRPTCSPRTCRVRCGRACSRRASVRRASTRGSSSRRSACRTCASTSRRSIIWACLAEIGARSLGTLAAAPVAADHGASGADVSLDTVHERGTSGCQARGGRRRETTSTEEGFERRCRRRSCRR